MRDEKKQSRHEAITKVAYDLLAEKGYNGTSMLSIAKAAKASNETLYHWYGDKRGLFETMVRDNAAHTKVILERTIAEQTDPDETLAQVAPVFLAMVLGDRAVLLNRAAAADPSFELGAAISAGGREVIQPLIETLIRRIGDKHRIEVQNMAGHFLGLLIADIQIKRVIGVQDTLTDAQIKRQCEMALKAFYQLIGITKP